MIVLDSDDEDFEKIKKKESTQASSLEKIDGYRESGDAAAATTVAAVADRDKNATAHTQKLVLY